MAGKTYAFNEDDKDKKVPDRYRRENPNTVGAYITDKLYQALERGYTGKEPQSIGEFAEDALVGPYARVAGNVAGERAVDWGTPFDVADVLGVNYAKAATTLTRKVGKALHPVAEKVLSALGRAEDYADPAKKVSAAAENLMDTPRALVPALHKTEPNEFLAWVGEGPPPGAQQFTSVDASFPDLNAKPFQWPLPGSAGERYKAKIQAYERRIAGLPEYDTTPQAVWSIPADGWRRPDLDHVRVQASALEELAQKMSRHFPNSVPDGAEPVIPAIAQRVTRAAAPRDKSKDK